MTLQTFLTHFKNNENPKRRYCFILGAGASKPSGIPTGGELAKIWLKEIKELYPEEVNKWMKDKKIDERNLATYYSQIYDKRFEIDPDAGFAFLAKTIEGKEPSFGHSVLVQILAKTNHNVAITINFDSLIEDAMFIYTQKKPLVCGHESLTRFIPTSLITRPLIAKIHRDILYAPKSSTDGTKELHEVWKNALTDILKSYTPVVIGYGGNDGSLMGFLVTIANINGGMFWCYRKKDGEPNKAIKKLVAKHNGYLVPIEGFDEMMLHINNILEYNLLDEKIIEVAKQRANKYRRQIWKSIGPNTIEALKEIIDRRKERSWWSVELAAFVEQDIIKKNEIYLKGIEEFPKSPELHNNYAGFLLRIKKEYVAAEKYFKQALKFDPNSVNTISNYAQLLIITRRKKKGKELIERALKLEPEKCLRAELWFYRYANFYSEYGEDAYEELEKLVEEGDRSVGWNYFKENIELAKKEGHPFIDKLEKINRDITEDTSI